MSLTEHQPPDKEQKGETGKAETQRMVFPQPCSACKCPARTTRAAAEEALGQVGCPWPAPSRGLAAWAGRQHEAAWGLPAMWLLPMVPCREPAPCCPALRELGHHNPASGSGAGSSPGTHSPARGTRLAASILSRGLHDCCFNFLVYKIGRSWQMAVKANKSISTGKQVNVLAF